MRRGVVWAIGSAFACVAVNPAGLVSAQSAGSAWVLWERSSLESPVARWSLTEWSANDAFDTKAECQESAARRLAIYERTATKVIPLADGARFIFPEIDGRPFVRRHDYKCWPVNFDPRR
jgi:hypothetical protein